MKNVGLAVVGIFLLALAACKSRSSSSPELDNVMEDSTRMSSFVHVDIPETEKQYGIGDSILIGNYRVVLSSVYYVDPTDRFRPSYTPGGKTVSYHIQFSEICRLTADTTNNLSFYIDSDREYRLFSMLLMLSNGKYDSAIDLKPGKSYKGESIASGPLAKTVTLGIARLKNDNSVEADVVDEINVVVNDVREKRK